MKNPVAWRTFALTLVVMTISVLVVSPQKINFDAPDAAHVSGPVAVVFGKKGDGLPEKLQVVGRINKVSFSRGCGVVLWSGTIELQLIEKVASYPYKRIYVVVNCLEDSENKKKYLGKVVKLEVSKLYVRYHDLRDQDPDTFYFELIDNTIDSRGLPFYCTNAGREDILRQ